MNEHQWLVGTDARAMIEWLGPRANARKLRLFSCALARFLLQLQWPDAGDCEVAGAGEALVNGAMTAADWAKVNVGGRGGFSPASAVDRARSAVKADDAYLGALSSIEAADAYFELSAPQTRVDAACKTQGWDPQVWYVREVFGNPFQPVSLQPPWLSEEVLSIAADMQQRNQFDRMLSLATALERAGCKVPVMIGHCEQAGPHARGCWLIDLLLRR